MTSDSESDYNDFIYSRQAELLHKSKKLYEYYADDFKILKSKPDSEEFLRLDFVKNASLKFMISEIKKSLSGKNLNAVKKDDYNVSFYLLVRVTIITTNV